MDACDVLIVGGGPAGSSCARRLHAAGLDVLILDKHRFPRDKICGGWITPPVLEELGIDPVGYARGRVFQPIRGFVTGRMGGVQVETLYESPVSFGIRRYEFDEYLLRRSGARTLEGEPFRCLERDGDSWIVNESIRTPIVIGAGGHFCPVARSIGAKLGSEPIVAAQESELPFDETQLARCTVRAEVPELFFCRDLKGYGWCFRKGNYLNVGLGRLDNRRLSGHVSAFVGFLKQSGKIPAEYPVALPGHAYLLYGSAPRPVAGEGVLLIGDAAGLAYWQSGEGIRPAVESGLMAAETVIEARGRYTEERLRGYRELLSNRFGKGTRDWLSAIGRRVPDRLVQYAGGKLMATSWFSRRVILDRWFLHAHETPLRPHLSSWETAPLASRP